MNSVALTAQRDSLVRIPSPEIIFHPHSFGDPAGRVFWWRGQLYRGIRSEWMPVLERLFDEGVIRRLVERGLLIESQPTALEVDGYELVVHHRAVPFPSYPEEWCPAMLKDAALAQIELLTELARYGFTLKDAHPWNILFEAWKPVYVDFSSIVPINHDVPWCGYDQFCRFFLNPLILMAHGQDRIARRLLPEIDGISKSEVSALMRPSFSLSSISTSINRSRLVLRPAAARLWRKRTAQTPVALVPQKALRPVRYLASLERLKDELEKITLPSARSEESGDHENCNPSPSCQSGWTAKQHTVHKILNDLRPTSVLNIGSNTGWYAKLVAANGSRVVCFDKSVTRVNQLYCDAREGRLAILPLVMDFTDPTPSRGLSSHWAVAATERFPCEMVLALSLVSQIVSKRYLNFEQIVGGLALFSKRWLVVEFVPAETTDSSRSQPRIPSSYKLDNFIDALRKQFRSVHLRPSHPEPHVLLFCEK
jgi:hypothetical protein